MVLFIALFGMLKKLNRAASGAVVVLLSTAPVYPQSAAYSYSGEVTSVHNSSVRFILDQSGTFSDYRDQSFSGTRHAFQVTLDPAALSVRFDEFRLTTPEVIFSRTETVTVGLGQTKAFSLNLVINPMTLSWGESTFGHSLTPGVGGDYKVGVTEPGFAAFYATGTMSGSYTITGPSQTITRSFSLPLSLDGSNSGGFVADRIGTLGYPTSLTVGSSTFSPTFYVANLVPATSSLFISEVVDGVSISTGIYRIYASGITDTAGNRLVFSEGALVAVPEPSTYAAIAGGVALGFALFFRRWRRASNYTGRNL